MTAVQQKLSESADNDGFDLSKLRIPSSVALGLVLLAGCGPAANTTMAEESPLDMSSDIKVTRVGVFEDQLAYGGKRGIYRIVDSKTGKEYIGISGVGISENGSHSSGKSSMSDER